MLISQTLSPSILEKRFINFLKIVILKHKPEDSPCLILSPYYGAVLTICEATPVLIARCPPTSFLHLAVCSPVTWYWTPHLDISETMVYFCSF